ncbi:MAG: YhdP family protein [Woeseiaceae bacterium]|nr:YhdP family protein [Woeseiaceae bacterium]
MKNLLARLIKFAAYFAAGVVILLAIAVGLFRLFLPRLPEYQDEIKSWASNAVGMQVEFSGMDARWGLRGPELKFYGTELIRAEGGERILAADEVGIGVSLVRLMIDRTLVVDTVTLRDTSIEARRLESGGWLIQGMPAEELLDVRGAAGDPGTITVIGEDIELQLLQPGDERPTFFNVSRIVAERDRRRLAIDANVRLPDTIGRQLRVSATHNHGIGETPEPWHVGVDAGDIDLAGIVGLLPGDFRHVAAGSGDVDVSLALASGGIVGASGNVNLEAVTLADGSSFDVRGRIAYSRDAEGWLMAADEFVMQTATASWPESSLHVEAGVDDDGDIVVVDARATFVNLADLAMIAPLLGDDVSTAFGRWSPDGLVENLQATVSDLDSDQPRYTVSASFVDAGVAADGKRPGVRGLTGALRADHDGGLLEVNAADLVIEIPAWVSRPVPIDVASGTIIWRHSDTRTTILSDSIALANAFLDSQSHIEIVLERDASPTVDLVSNWSLSDLNAAKAYIPEPIMSPRLFLWFQDALIAGEMPRGTTRLYGPLDRFPFDGGEGRLLVEATVRDLQFRYARQFPVANVSDMQVTLDNLRLYTEQNRSVSTGNTTVDARVEIADLREPVLTIDAYSTGTLATIRDFAAQSPISRIFGGQLDRVDVAGEASLALDLVLPIKDWRSFEFTARITSNDGTLTIDGLGPPISELTGAVTIERELVTSEALGGRFLGETVAIEMRNAAADMPGYRVIAGVTGEADADAIVEGFGLPLAGRLGGRIAYRADVLFPRAGHEPPMPFAVRVSSELRDLAIDLPAPIAKSAGDELPTEFEIAFLPGGGEIRAHGNAGADTAWLIAFTRQSESWDFDRGTLAFGGAPADEPDVRGLHIRGTTPRLDFADWLSLSRGDESNLSAADRIRSIDLGIGELTLLGQKLDDHRVRVDRSARDWLVQFDGEHIAGSVFVPYEFDAERPLVLDMQRLILPGDDTEDAGDDREDDVEPTPLDPRRLPAISLSAGEFALGERHFGAVSAEFAKTPEGLSSDDILASDPSFEIVGNGRWVADADDPRGSRSFLTATLTSNNVEQTMLRLDYTPGIVSSDMGILLDLNWSGGPAWDFLDTLDGSVQVRFGSGQLDEVDPGAGRVFGLMSVVALPRRLSLDFRDVFQKGFGFDEISGTFRIDDGVAYTCDLSLSGPAADIGIIGRADLVERSYEQTAVVSANVGNTLPVVGAIAAGPQAAAALFLFSQIFKKPLQDIGQVYYRVGGSWDEPSVESANAAAFAAAGEAAGCLAESG